MFLLSCASIAVAQVMITQVDIPIEHRRPSKMMGVFETNGKRTLAPMAIIEPNDGAGTLSVRGSARDIEEIRKVVALVDIPRQRAEISIDVWAPTDKMHYVQTVELYPNQAWTSKESDLGLTISILVGSQLRQSVTLTVISQDKAHTAQSKFWLDLGHSATQTWGNMVPSGWVVPGGKADEKAPTITFKFLGLHGE